MKSEKDMKRTDVDGQQNAIKTRTARRWSLLRSLTPLFLASAFAISLVLFCYPSHARQQPDAKHSSATQSPVLLQLRSEVEVDSFIVRIRDVILPVGTQPDNWNEISGKAIALLPSDGRRLRMERQRISECLERSGLLRQPTQWSGPNLVSIAYVPRETPIDYQQTTPPRTSASANSQQSDSHVVQASFAEPNTSEITATRNLTKPKQPAFPNLFPAERNRIERMILAAFPQTHAEVLQRFEVSIARDDHGINGLKDLRAVRSLRLSEAPRTGRIQLWVSGETELREVEASVDIELIELPVVVYTTTALNKGDILSARDLIAKPIARSQYDAKLVSDIELLLNKEIVRPLSADRPISQQDVSEPIIIKRGDQVVLQVVGAGVMVTTDARALAPAAAGESVMIETAQPKQKLVARAVRTGIVEIVSRPPNIDANR